MSNTTVIVGTESSYVRNITIPIGSDFEKTFFLKTTANSILDLTSYTGASSLKKHSVSTSSTPITLTFTNRSTGEIKISLGSSITSSLKSGRYVYDILLNSGTKKTRIVEGSVIVTAGITTTI